MWFALLRKSVIARGFRELESQLTMQSLETFYLGNIEAVQVFESGQGPK